MLRRLAAALAASTVTACSFIAVPSVDRTTTPSECKTESLAIGADGLFTAIGLVGTIVGASYVVADRRRDDGEWEGIGTAAGLVLGIPSLLMAASFGLSMRHGLVETSACDRIQRR